MSDLINKLRRGMRKPPKVIIARILAMLTTQTERLRLPRRTRMPLPKLLAELGAPSLDVLWRRLGSRPFPAWLEDVDRRQLEKLCGEMELHKLFERAEAAMAHRVNLLGSGDVELGDTIDWHTDFKTGYSWPPQYFADIEYNNPDRPSDVKVPWELSRLQWLIPVGQAYLCSRDDNYALAAKAIFSQWIDANVCGGSVNWSCTMEAAMRVFTWVWFFHVFKKSDAWDDDEFRFKFLRALFLQVEFTQRHIERSDVNGNHYTADASAIVVGGLFFGEGELPLRWQQEGWRILLEELPRQFDADGVNFEASVPYHRLVVELFLLPARYRSILGSPVDEVYKKHLTSMACFTRAYNRPDGTVPLWGDADDARVLPFGCQQINDHRYLNTTIGLYLDRPELCNHTPHAIGEVLWSMGPEQVQSWLANLPQAPASQAFPNGGFFVMRRDHDHVFVDCGPVGLAGRGGHGHNDCLSFELMLKGERIISDCGAYLYTASYSERNAFRSTGYHNTPQIDGEEINRFIAPNNLWNLHFDAKPNLVCWKQEDHRAIFVGEHSGYRRLGSGVTPHRTIIADFDLHAVSVTDCFEGNGLHDVLIPLHLASGVRVVIASANEIVVTCETQQFRLWWPDCSGYSVRVEPARISPSYGVVEASHRIVWQSGVGKLKPFTLYIAPIGSDVSYVASRLNQHRFEIQEL